MSTARSPPFPIGSCSTFFNTGSGLFALSLVCIQSQEDPPANFSKFYNAGPGLFSPFFALYSEPLNFSL